MSTPDDHDHKTGDDMFDTPLVWYQPPESEGWTEDQVREFNQQLNMELLSFPGVLSLNISMSARMHAHFDMPDPGTPEEIQQTWLKLVREAIELTAEVTKTELPAALKMGHTLILEAMTDPNTVDHNAHMLVQALTELTYVAQGVNPFEDEDDDDE